MSDFKTVEWKKRNYAARGSTLFMSRGGERKVQERIVYPFPLPIVAISQVFETQSHGFMVVSMGLTPGQVLKGQVQTEILHLHPSIDSEDDPAASIVEGAGTRLNGPCLEVAYERRAFRNYLDTPRYEPANGYLGMLEYLIAQHLREFEAGKEKVIPVTRQLRAATVTA